MPDTLTPVAAFPSYPLTNIPKNKETANATILKDIYQDIHNRLQFLKNTTDDLTTKKVNAETKLGFNFDNSSLVTFTSGVLLSAPATVKNAVEILDTNSGVVSTTLVNLGTNLGGNVQDATPLVYTTPQIISDGDSHHVAIEKLDEQAKTNQTSISTISTTVTTHSGNITNISNKVGDSAELAGTGFLYSSTNFIANNDKLKVCVEKLDKPVFTLRRRSNHQYLYAVQNWRDTAFGESGGVTPNNFHYDDLVNSTNINPTHSTVGAYDSIDQSFGLTSGVWTYVSNIKTIPSGLTKIKIKFNAVGSVTASANFQGDFVTSFVNIPNQDTYVTVTTGTQLVIKFTGAIGARLYDYMVLYKA